MGLMLLCPETFQSWASGLHSLLTGVDGLTAVCVLGNSLQQAGLHAIYLFKTSKRGDLSWGLCSCSLWGSGSTRLPSHLFGSLDPINMSDLRPADTTPGAPMSL